MTTEKSGEFRGKTVDAAVSAGLAALKLSLDDVTVEIVRQGSRGVLGIGAEDAVVRLTSVQPSKPELKPAPKPEPKATPELLPPARPTPVVHVEPRPAAPTQPRPVARPDEPAPVVAMSDKDAAAAQQGREILLGLLERMDLRADVEMVPQSDAETEGDDRELVLNIVGDDLGVLIGRQNETLSALEFVTRLMVNQQTHSRTGFLVDVNGYRAKRAESLRRLALRMADQVVQTGRTVAMEPMPPAERRIIHLALRDHATVSTQSIGEGDRRKVTIVPKKD